MKPENHYGQCGACGKTDIEICSRAGYYTAGGTLMTDLARCSHCGTWFRTLDCSLPEFVSHFDVASYTDLDSEDRFWCSRKDFFRFLLRLCECELGKATGERSLLDIGCSYGHMMDVFGAAGYRTAGVEIVAALRDRLQRKGHQAYAHLSEVPPVEQFDVIALIDSLYCVDQPREILNQARVHLKNNGILLLRVANRTPVLDLLHRLRRPITSAVLGDSKYVFSAKGIRILCERSGFHINRVVLLERGKRLHGVLKSVYYRATPLISRLTGYLVTPGLVFLCGRK